MPLNIIPESEAPTGPATGFGASMSQLFSNPNFLNLLAGIGAKLDPEGVGGAIGVPTQQFIANTAAQKVAAKSLAQGKELTEAHKQLISTLGGFSAKGTPGVTSAKVNDSGSMTLEVDPHPVSSDPNNVESLISDNAKAYPDTSLTDMSGRKFVPKLGSEAEPSVQNQVDDFLSPWPIRRPMDAPVNDAQNTGAALNALDSNVQKVNVQTPAAGLERIPQLALDSYKSLDAPTRSRIHRAVESALVQNPSLTADELLAVMGIESHFQPNAIGPVTREGWSARGLMQLSPGVLRKYGVSDPHNIEMNINAGAAEFARLKAKYNGDQNLALAAYNAEEGAVQKYNGQVPNYPETKAYVRNVPALSAALINLANGTGASPEILAENVANVDVGPPFSPSTPIASDLIASSPAASNGSGNVSATEIGSGNVSATPDTAAQVQDLISTGVDTAGVRGAPRSNLITADDLRGLNPEQINAIVGKAQQNDALAVQIAELTGQAARDIRKNLDARQLEMRKAKLSAAKDISESSLSPAQQKAALERLGSTQRLDDVLELAITAAGLPKAPSVGADREAVSSEKYGLKYSQLTSPQQEVVNKELVARSASGSEVVNIENVGTFVVDKRTGTARQVTIAPGSTPIPGANQTVTQSPMSVTPSATSPSATIPGDTSTTLTPGSALPGKPGAKPTEDQAKSLNFGTRANAANRILASIEEQGITGTSSLLSTLEGISRINPITATGVGGGIGAGLAALGGASFGSIVGIVTNPVVAVGGALSVGGVLLAEPIANRLRTPEQQKSFQARADFVGAILRKESGAAISTAEYEREEARYFPRPNDSIEVLQQKAKARERAILTLEKESGQKLAEPIVADRDSYFKRSTGFYREQFKNSTNWSSDKANSYLIARNYAGSDAETLSAGKVAYKQVFGEFPKYVEYGAKKLPEDLAPLTSGAKIELMNKISNSWVLPLSLAEKLDGWLIALNGLDATELSAMSVYKRAAIRTRMKVLGLPRKSE